MSQGVGGVTRRQGARFAVASLLFLLVTAGCTHSSDGEGSPSPSPSVTASLSGQKALVTVYVQGAWTGRYSYLALPFIQGAQMQARALSDDPAFPATITVAKADTKGDPAEAPAVVQRVVADPNTVAVAGPVFSGESLASGDDYESAKIPFITGSAKAVDLASSGWDYWYRTIGNDELQGSADGRFLAQVAHVGKLFLVNDGSAYGQRLAGAVGGAAKDQGISVVGDQSAAAGADSYASLIDQVRTSGADGLFYGGYDADFGRLVKQAKAAHLDITWMSGDGSVSSAFLDAAGPAADGVYLSAPSQLGGPFATRYRAAYKGDASPVPVYAAEGYDVMGLIGAGIKTAMEGGASSPDEIRAGIKTYLDTLTPAHPYHGIVRSIAFTQPQHELDVADPDTLLYFYRVVDGGLKQLGTAADLLK